MTRTGLAFAAAAAFAVGAADLAVADATIDIAEPARLTFVEGPTDYATRMRWAAGDVDDRGVVYAEYFTGTKLESTLHFVLAHVDGVEMNVRLLTDIVPISANADGLTFSAHAGGDPVTCLAVMWSDASVQCRRDPAYVSSYDPRCVKAFKSNVQQFQCNGLITLSAAPAIPYEVLLQKCAPFRGETNRMDCVRYGHANPDRWPEGLAACLGSYRGEDERRFCMFYSFAVVGQAPSAGLIRGCKGATDEATTDCVFLKMTGVKQAKEKHTGKLWPTQRPTDPLVLQRPTRGTIQGARIDIGTGKFQEKELRVTGGMVGDLPVLWVDGYANGKLDWSSPVDRLVLGKRLVALRDTTSLDRVKVSGALVTFRAVYAGKPITCRLDAPSVYATCR